jgi:hypothetical protein
MSVPIYVDAHSGHRANEKPRQFVLDEEIYEIAAIEDQWYSPDGQFFKVRTTDEKHYILRYAEGDDEWTLQSGFNGDELLARPGVEIVTINPPTIRDAEGRIESCEHCRPNDADRPFDWVLAEITNKWGMFDFVLIAAARCPNCKHEIHEKTLVDLKD